MPSTHETEMDWSFHRDHGLTPIINVSGTMTSIGASTVGAEVQGAMAAILPRFVEMHELQTLASKAIVEATGAEAGFVTACASAGVTLSVAGAITGLDAGLAERLPEHAGERPEVVVQSGHLCHYGAPITQAIALTGARVVSVGQSTHVQDHQLAAGLSERTKAAVFVASHHVVHYGQMPLARFAEICHARGVPVIVDAASEYDLTGFLAQGADVVVYSAHKFLGGPTAGIVAGGRPLVRAAYLQNLGLGRGMKVGKESIFGTIAALQQWRQRDTNQIAAAQQATLDAWRGAMAESPGVRVETVPDPTGNPLSRLQVWLDPEIAGATAAQLAVHLASGNPAIITRTHEVELGYLLLDPCNLTAGQAEVVTERLQEALALAQASGLPAVDLNDLRNRGTTGYLNWGGA